MCAHMHMDTHTHKSYWFCSMENPNTVVPLGSRSLATNSLTCTQEKSFDKGQMASCDQGMPNLPSYHGALQQTTLCGAA